MHFKIRLGSKNTSISLRDNFFALWFVLSRLDKKHDEDYAEIRKEAWKLVLSALKTWPDSSVKGLSGSIHQWMLESLLEKNDLIRYKKVLKCIEEGEAVVRGQDMYANAPVYETPILSVYKSTEKLLKEQKKEQMQLQRKRADQKTLRVIRRMQEAAKELQEKA